MWAPFAVLALVSSIYMPLLALASAAAWCLAMLLYSIGFVLYGPKGKIVGIILGVLALLCAFTGAIWTIVIWEPSEYLEDRKFRIWPLSFEKLQLVLDSKV